MAAVVPTTDKKNAAKAAEVTAVATAVAAAVGPFQVALQAKQIQLNAELVDSLMASGALSPLTILSTCTYNT